MLKLSRQLGFQQLICSCIYLAYFLAAPDACVTTMFHSGIEPSNQDEELEDSSSGHTGEFCMMRHAGIKRFRVLIPAGGMNIFVCFIFILSITGTLLFGVEIMVTV